MPATAKRSTAKDGLGNKLQFKLLTSCEPLWRAVQRTPPLERVVNRALINSGVLKAPPRPYRLSTRSDYTSMESLTDRPYNSRQLAPVSALDPTLPDPVEVAELFRRPVRQTADGDVEVKTECAKSTVLFAYVAQWFTDGFLRSRRAEPDAATRYGPMDPRRYRDIQRSESTQEIDMTQLYGLNPAQTDALRAMEGGLLKSLKIGGEEFPPLLCDASGQIKAEFAALPEPVGFRNPRLTPEQKARLFAMGSDAGNSQIGYGLHAFSQLLTNPLLAKGIWDHPETFSPEGRRIIDETTSLAQLARRNLPADAPDYEVRLTRAGWTRV